MCTLRIWRQATFQLICFALPCSCLTGPNPIPQKDTVTVTMTSELLSSVTPSEILQKLEAGNKRFVNGNMLHRDFQKQIDITSGGQYPDAIIVSCIDSRNPNEFIFDTGIGDLFNARVAGNFVNTDILGSIDYACKVSGAKMIVIMGHTGCRAIKSA